MGICSRKHRRRKRNNRAMETIEYRKSWGRGRILREWEKYCRKSLISRNMKASSHSLRLSQRLRYHTAGPQMSINREVEMTFEADSHFLLLSRFPCLSLSALAPWLSRSIFSFISRNEHQVNITTTTEKLPNKRFEELDFRR